MKPISIAGRRLGDGCSVFVVAEAGVNHNGRLDLARRLVDVAVTAGADAIKFQTFKAEHVVSPEAPKAAYQVAQTDPEESQFQMIKRLELPFAAFRELHAYCQTKGVLFLSTPFDEDSVSFLCELDVPAMKIASGEVTNLPFLASVARTGKPVILSTGMSTLEEVEDAVKILRASGTQELVLLQCVSNYPADPADVNLRAMRVLAETFDVPVGYSDHTRGAETALAAVALGACVIEKHLTLDRRLPGPDHQASADPAELAALVRGIRTVEAALGDGRKVPAPRELAVAAVARRSLVAATDIPAGATLTAACVAIRRPGTGLPPSSREHVLGRRAKMAIEAGTLIQLEMLS